VAHPGRGPDLQCTHARDREDSLEKLAAQAAGPLPAEPRAQIVWGATQLLVGVRLLLAHRRLWGRAVLPVVVLLLVAAAVGFASWNDGLTVAAKRSYAFLLGAGAAPAFVFANSYARFAADAHELLGFGKAEPHLTTLRQRISQVVRFALVTVVPMLPFLILAKRIPGVGKQLAFALSGLWTLYFTVVEQLDNARIRRPVAERETLVVPWFVAWTHAEILPRPVRAVTSRFGRFCARLARPWVEEIALTRRHPAPSLGLGGAVGVLLLVPILNVLVRPIAIVAGVHLRARTEGTAEPEARAESGYAVEPTP
jgi:Etoposide-induced protein 2.4 (EI24)